MGLPHPALSPSRPLTHAELQDWEEAYAAVEAYLSSLRLRNRLLISHIVHQVLQRAVARKEEEPQVPARVIAMEEVIAEVANWTTEVLNVPLEHGRLAARGRLALLLAEMPGKWQGVFLTAPPWPEGFTRAMQSSYIAAGPAFAQRHMKPEPLEFNVLGSGVAQWRQAMDRSALLRILSLVLILSLAVFAIWYFGQ